MENNFVGELVIYWYCVQRLKLQIFSPTYMIGHQTTELYFFQLYMCVIPSIFNLSKQIFVKSKSVKVLCEAVLYLAAL